MEYVQTQLMLQPCLSTHSPLFFISSALQNTLSYLFSYGFTTLLPICWRRSFKRILICRELLSLAQGYVCSEVKVNSLTDWTQWSWIYSARNCNSNLLMDIDHLLLIKFIFQLAKSCLIFTWCLKCLKTKANQRSSRYCYW
jgi:hypothetical protein